MRTASSELLASIQKVVGPTRQLTPDNAMRSRFLHVAAHEGREVRVSLTGGIGLGQRLYLGVSLQKRPLSMWIQPETVDVKGAEALKGAPPGYRDGLTARGNPREVLGQVLFDTAVMQALIAKTGCDDALFFTEAGFLFIEVDAQKLGDEREAETIAAWLEGLIEIADRLVASFDETAALVEERQGADAAAQWRSEQQRALAQRPVRPVSKMPLKILSALILLVLFGGAVLVQYVLMQSGYRRPGAFLMDR